MGTPARERADKLVVEAGLAESRQKAQALILAGQIVADDHVVKKSGDLISTTATLRIKGDPMPFVSRGGLKLQHALDHFAIDVGGLSGLDVGASTGGFTDCLLQRGCIRVCAVDVGTNQLAWKLRQDPRVVSMEQVNARSLQPADLPFSPDISVCDVSFISLTLVMPSLVAPLRQGAPIVALVKPQFEVGREGIEKGGVVRDPRLHVAAIEKCKSAAVALGCDVRGVVESPITGPAGNIEFLLYCVRGAS
ncbi:MAG: TlyA family RNA methyltransferase [Polyangia bacterium]